MRRILKRQCCLLLTCLLLLAGCTATDKAQPDAAPQTPQAETTGAAPTQPEEPQQTLPSAPHWIISQSYELPESLASAFQTGVDGVYTGGFYPLAYLAELDDGSSCCVLCQQLDRTGEPKALALVYLERGPDGSALISGWAPLDLEELEGPETAGTAPDSDGTGAWSISVLTRPDQRFLAVFEDAVQGRTDPVYTPLVLLADCKRAAESVYCVLCRAEHLGSTAEGSYALLFVRRDWSWRGSLLTVAVLDLAAGQEDARPLFRRVTETESETK